MEVKKEFNPYHTKGSVVYGRIKTFFLGKEKPRLFTRINAVIAFVYLLYILLWSLIVFIALSSGKNLPHSENWNNIFNSLGQKYRIPDIHLAFKSYLFSQFIAAALIAIGIIFSWRKKISGYHLLFTGIAIALSGALILLGFDYVQNECGWWEFTSGGVVCVLFLLDFLTFKKSY